MDAEFIKDLAMSMNRATLAGMTSGAEIGRQEAQAEIKRLRGALQALCDAEEQYGDETNVAVNAAWLKAKEELAK